MANRHTSPTATWGQWPGGASFWGQVVRASHRLLMLDYDGTLAPFTPQRDQAVPYPGVPEFLHQLQEQGQTRVVLVSGRESKVVASLLGMQPPPEIWGCHGGERLLPDGTVLPVAVGQQQEKGLQKAAALARAQSAAEALEYKPGCLAFHWRGTETKGLRNIGQVLHPVWNALATESALALHPFDGGMELRAEHLSKAAAVQVCLSEYAQHRVAVAYLGDDQTDEDAFCALPAQGLGVLVRPIWRDTRASLWLVPPEELLQFLRRWKEAAAAMHQW